jgi:DNA invertase Pin-like site-specific DNA recombinase
LRFALEKHIDVVATFIEKGESATAASRTELLKALDYCKQQKRAVEAFIVWKLDRFARNTTDHYGLQAQLTKYGTRLLSATEPIVSEGPLGKMAEAMLAGYAQFENDIRKQRCEAGMQRKVAEGIWPWHPPIGYVHSKTRLDRRKTRPDEPDPERFHAIQRGLREFARGEHSTASLTLALNSRGLRTRAGRPLYKQAVDRMLTDEFYAGVLINPWTRERHPGQHQAMITAEEYLDIQTIKAAWSNGATQRRRIANPDFPLRQFVYCTCGRGLTGSWHTGKTQKYAYYNCQNSGCRFYGNYVDRDTLEGQFVNSLTSIAPTSDLLEIFVDEVRTQWHARHRSAEQHESENARRRRALSLQKDRLVQMRLSDEITPAEYAEQRKRLEAQMVMLSSPATAPTGDLADLDGAVRTVCSLLDDPGRYWRHVSDINKKRALQRWFFPDGMTYHFDSATYGTPHPSRLVTLFAASKRRESYVVAGLRRNWNEICRSVKVLHEILKDVPPTGQCAAETSV